MFLIVMLDRAWEILMENRRAYLVFNALYYGLLLFFMVLMNIYSAPQESTLNNAGRSYITGPLALAGHAGMDYATVKSVTGTFLVNLLSTNYGTITFPSFIIPFFGVATGLYRAVTTGILFSPANPGMARIFLPHLPTLLLEGQAAILSILGVYIHGRALIWPQTVGQESHWKGYVEGVRQAGTLFMIMMPVLIISAIYGIIESVMIAPFP